MMNKTLFASQTKSADPALIVNEAGGKAYRFDNKHALAQLVATGTLSHTFYVDAKMQLQQVLDLAASVDAEFIAKTAVYARQHALMKDMPILLLAILSMKEDGQESFKAAFPKVVDNGKQLRNFVQMLRSGVIGRKSLGSLPKKMVNAWLTEASDYQLLSASVGSEPSLADVIKMTHPKPKMREQEAFFAYVLGKPYEFSVLPERVQQLIRFRVDVTQPIPDVPIQLLMGLGLDVAQWATVARQGSWQMIRMNLNNFAKYGVFEQDGMVDRIAEKLVDIEAVRKSRVFPYQLLMTWSALDEAVPERIRSALARAMDISLANVPQLSGRVVVAVDVSGSMQFPVTGCRKGASSKLRCVDAAALFAAALKRVNPDVRIMPFDTRVHEDVNTGLIHTETKQTGFWFKGRSRRSVANPKLDVLELAAHLASKGGGGTDCSLPLKLLNAEQAQIDTMIYFSDNESWVDARLGRGTAMMAEWDALKSRSPNARLVCVDVQPYPHAQVKERHDVLNIGGFADEVFRLIGLFARDELHADHWVHEIEQIQLRVN
ncbi:MAG: TROVE domain-containing protein [Gammaproteobacteria bacterium]|nr:TROVE domain-containing protein [Gammaproteobacteria bacterium]